MEYPMNFTNMGLIYYLKPSQVAYADDVDFNA